MKKVIQFSGLGFESGQSKKGLISSPQKAREYFYILKNAGIEIQDYGDVLESESLNSPKFYSNDDLVKYNFDKLLEAFKNNSRLYKNEKTLVSWGGDHSVGISTVSAFLKNYTDGYVLWIDAHADLNLPAESMTGHLHGMPLAIAMNLDGVAKTHFGWIENYLNPEKLIYLGVRDLDPFERASIEKMKITCFSMDEINRLGIESVMEMIKAKIKQAPLHVSFDIDSVDPEYAPSTGVPVKNGLSVLDLTLISESVQYMNVKSIDIVELNPHLGNAIEIDQTFITGTHFLKNILAYPGGNDESMGNGIKAKHETEMEWTL